MRGTTSTTGTTTPRAAACDGRVDDRGALREKCAPYDPDGPWDAWVRAR
ncbi:MAG: hypothetical protein H6713_26685 [Myxococcales bacterium]|nr:hypothetical protein [Myxococcales bacterium]